MQTIRYWAFICSIETSLDGKNFDEQKEKEIEQHHGPGLIRMSYFY
jgi:hypothetical protein